MSTLPDDPQDPNARARRDADVGARELPPDTGNEAAVRYWGAIYAYIRQSGRRDDEARELTQGFIADVLLGRNLLSKLDEGRGQFRTLLLSSVRNYLADVYRFDHAARRHPGRGRLRADDGSADGMADREPAELHPEAPRGGHGEPEVRESPDEREGWREDPVRPSAAPPRMKRGLDWLRGLNFWQSPSAHGAA